MYPQDGRQAAEVQGFHYFRENFTLSHSRERKEKICLNCSTELHGRYCHACGQENIEPKESVWGLVTHFFYDITHFDGKFFSTLKYLAFKPGFLSKEYVKGRRASYLNPIRMYVFTSAIFFIIFFSIAGIENIGKNDSSDKKTKSNFNFNTNLTAARDSALKEADTKEDSAAIIKVFGAKGLDDSTKLRLEKSEDEKDTTAAKGDVAKKSKSGWRTNLGRFKYKTIEQYDSAQRSLPPDKRDNWFERLMNRRSITLNKKYGEDDNALMRAWLNSFIHQFPKLLFISLPIFALILRLLYIRRRKQFYYVDHGIFAIHIYIFSFIVLLVAFGLGWLDGLTGLSLFSWLQAPLWIYLLYYDYKAMRNFYGQGTGKTLVKFLLLNFLAFITILILFVAFFIFAAFQL